MQFIHYFVATSTTRKQFTVWVANSGAIWRMRLKRTTLAEKTRMVSDTVFIDQHLDLVINISLPHTLFLFELTLASHVGNKTNKKK